MSNSTCTDKTLVWCILSTDSQKENVIRYGKPSNKCMIYVFIETNMFVIGSKTVDLVFLNENDIIDQRSSTSEVINSLIISFFKNFHILFTIG